MFQAGNRLARMIILILNKILSYSIPPWLVSCDMHSKGLSHAIVLKIYLLMEFLP